MANRDYLHFRIKHELGERLACHVSITGARSSSDPYYLLASPALDGEDDNECPECLKVARQEVSRRNLKGG